MSSVLALDCSTAVGFAYFATSDGAPRCGTWRAPKSWAVEDYGERFLHFHNWLCDTMTAFQPDVLAFESPILPRGSMDMQTTEHTLRLLIGFAAIAELLAKLRGIRCFEVNVSTAKRMLAGSGRAEKDDMVIAATRRGWPVADHHQADATAVALVAMASLKARSAT